MYKEFQDTERRAGLKALIRYFCVQLLSQVRVFVTTGVLYFSRLTQSLCLKRHKSVCDLILQLFVLSLTEWAASMSWVSGSPTTQSQDGFKHFTTPTAALSRLDVFHPEILTVGPPNSPSCKVDEAINSPTLLFFQLLTLGFSTLLILTFWGQIILSWGSRCCPRALAGCLTVPLASASPNN